MLRMTTIMEKKRMMTIEKVEGVVIVGSSCRHDTAHHIAGHKQHSADSSSYQSKVQTNCHHIPHKYH